MTALALMFLLGAIVGYVFPRAWAQASAADRLEAMTRSGPLRRAKR